MLFLKFLTEAAPGKKYRKVSSINTLQTHPYNENSVPCNENRFVIGSNLNQNGSLCAKEGDIRGANIEVVISTKYAGSLCTKIPNLI